VRALGYGLLSGIIASLLLWLLSSYAQQRIEELTLLHNENQFVTLLMILSVMGIIVAAISTFFSIHKYLKMSLDELY
jgi:cell division transport system permease protein